MSLLKKQKYEYADSIHLICELLCVHGIRNRNQKKELHIAAYNVNISSSGQVF